MEPFALSQKIEDLCVLLHEAVSKYPKCERHTLARDTLSCAVHAGMAVAKGNKISGMGERLRCMHQADSEIAQVKILLKLALRLSSSGCPYLSIKKYEQISDLIGEIGSHRASASVASFIAHYKHCSASRSVRSVLSKIIFERKSA